MKFINSVRQACQWAPETHLFSAPHPSHSTRMHTPFTCLGDPNSGYHGVEAGTHVTELFSTLEMSNCLLIKLMTLEKCFPPIESHILEKWRKEGRERKREGGVREEETEDGERWVPLRNLELIKIYLNFCTNSLIRVQGLTRKQECLNWHRV